MYQALYRKWRPMTFEEVVGQQHVVSMLRSSIAAGKISHAYLLCGTRGTGKTTIARLLAKAVNCESPINGDPCNQCASCRAINAGSNIDIAEIDAASNNGVDNVRDIRDEVVYTPAMSKYKVYIIDEVHMLSTGAFNALLKTLEEPPSHVIFILATTELAKVPATIVSRCQRFDFHRIPAAEITALLLDVCKKEAISVEPKAAELIARLADGGMRDALSILDQCASSGGTVTYSLVSEITGLGGRDYLIHLIDAVAGNDSGAALKILSELFSKGKEPAAVIEEMTAAFRDLLMIKCAHDYGALLLSPPDEAESLAAVSGRFTAEEVLYLLSVLQAAADTVQRSANKRIDLEVAVLKLCSPKLAGNLEALAARIARLETAVASGVSVPIKAEAEPPKRTAKEKKAEEKPTEKVDGTSVVPEASGGFDFTKYLPELNAAYDKSIANVMKGARYKASGNRVVIEFESDFQANFIGNDAVKQQIAGVIASVTGRNFEILVTKKAPAPEAPAGDPFSALVGRIREIPGSKIE